MQCYCKFLLFQLYFLTSGYICYQNLPGGLGGAFFMQGSGPTLADLLQSIPDHSYTEGESIFADLAMTLVSCHCGIRCD